MKEERAARRASAGLELEDGGEQDGGRVPTRDIGHSGSGVRGRDKVRSSGRTVQSGDVRGGDDLSHVIANYASGRAQEAGRAGRAVAGGSRLPRTCQADT